MGFLRKTTLFFLGGFAYCALELMWRGRTHGSMFLAGGAALLLIGQLNHVKPRLPLPLRAVVGSGIITMVELAAGLLFNRNYSVWDYRGQWGNYMGQICPLFSLLWVGLAAMVLLVYDPLERVLQKVEEGH